MQSFVSIRFSQHDRTVSHVIQRARAQAPLHLLHKFFDVKSLFKILPLLSIVIAKSRQHASGISSRHAVFVRRLGDLVSAKKVRTEGGVCKVLCQQKHVWEMEGSLSARWMICLDLGNGTIMLHKLFNPEWQITSKSFLLSSFLIGFSFSPTAEISRLELEFKLRKFAAENRVNLQRGDWTRVKWSSQSRKTNFLTLPDLAFGFVHKRSGNEILVGALSSSHARHLDDIYFVTSH